MLVSRSLRLLIRRNRSLFRSAGVYTQFSRMFPCINLKLVVRFVRQPRRTSTLFICCERRRSPMPINEELTIRMDNRPGSLGKVCRALADRGVNILAFQSIPAEKTILVCMVVDNPAAAAAILDEEGISYTEGEIAQAKLPHGPGELARAASKLGDANINIHYAYCGVEPSTNAPLVIFGVSEVGRAATILDQTAAAAATTAAT